MTALPLEVETMHSDESLSAFRPEWHSFWTACRTATPFQSPGWLLAWWKQFGSGRPRVIVLRRSETPVGVVPLFEDESPASRLQLMGFGITDRLDPLLGPDVAEQAATAALAHLARMPDWSRCEFEHISEASPLLRSAAPDAWADDIRPQEVCPALLLPKLARHLPDCIPSEQWKKLNYYRRRAARDGPLQFEQATERTFEPLLETLFQLHARQWCARGLPGVLADAAVREFHREAAWNLLHSGVLRLYAMSIGGRTVACLYGFMQRNRAYYYLSGFDPQFGRLSPGMLIVGHAIERAIEDGATEFDFLRGQEPYKYRWGATDRLTCRRVLRRSADQVCGAGNQSDALQRQHHAR